MTGIIKTDQLQGAQSTTITIPTGNKISITDSATIGTLNATTMRGTTTFADSAVFSGTVSGDNNDMVLLNTTTISGATANVTFENLFDDAYATFIIRGTNITSNASSDQDDFVAYKARGGSSTYDTDATY